MILEDVNTAFEHKIVSGSEYQWNCFGPNARFLDFESEHATGSIVYDTKTFCVYEATVNDKDDQHRYRWIEPSVLEALEEECSKRDINFHIAWDNLTWYDLEVEEDFLEKAKAIFSGKSFDKRVKLPLDLTEAEILQLALEAHERDITLNQMIEILLKEAIEGRKLSTE